MANKKIIYTNIPKNNNRFNWNNSVGCFVDFEYDNHKGRLFIIERIKPDKVKIEYEGKWKILPQDKLMLLKIGDLLGEIDFNYKYDIGYEFGKNSHKMKIINRYKKGRKIYLVECLKCGYTKEITESRIKRKEGCPVCMNQKIIVGINDMWTTNPELASLLANPEDGYKYSQHSGKKLIWKCKYCNSNSRPLSPSYVSMYGLKCQGCDDGFSYPNKFIFNLLSVLGVEFETEKIFEWSNHKRYDFFLPQYNGIIAANGKQHYQDSYFDTYEQIRKNDEYKHKLAIENGIENYVIIDCSFSYPNYIFNNVCNSYLSNILNFESVDICYIDELCQKNIMYELVKLYDEGNNIEKIYELTKISKSQIIRLLKKADSFGLTKYDKKKYQKEALEKIRISSYQNNAKPIKCLNNGFVFGTHTIVANNSEQVFGRKISLSGICNSVNHNKPIFELNFVYISREEFNEVKCTTPEKAFGDLFILREEVI